MTLTCNHCGEPKPESAFNRSSASRTGRRGMCRDCEKRKYPRAPKPVKTPRVGNKSIEADPPAYARRIERLQLICDLVRADLGTGRCRVVGTEPGSVPRFVECR